MSRIIKTNRLNLCSSRTSSSASLGKANTVVLFYTHLSLRIYPLGLPRSLRIARTALTRCFDTPDTPSFHHHHSQHSPTPSTLAALPAPLHALHALHALHTHRRQCAQQPPGAPGVPAARGPQGASRRTAGEAALQRAFTGRAAGGPGASSGKFMMAISPGQLLGWHRQVPEEYSGPGGHGPGGRHH